MRNAVGPVLRMTDELDAVISAIQEDNPDLDIEVVDRGAYVRVMGEKKLRVTQASIERHLGREFRMRELEAMLSSFAGRITTTSSEITWEHKRDLDAASGQ